MFIADGTCYCGANPKCDNGKTCLPEGECGCGLDEQCQAFATDNCDLTTGLCRCGNRPACEVDECVDGNCGVSIDQV